MTLSEFMITSCERVNRPLWAELTKCFYLFYFSFVANDLTRKYTENIFLSTQRMFTDIQYMTVFGPLN